MNFSTITRPHSDRHTMNSLVSSFLMIRLICLICLICLIQFTLGGCRRPATATRVPRAIRPPAETFVIEVSGMHCDNCAEAITAKVAKIDGVTSCEADWERGTTTVLARPDTIPTIQDSIARMGFTIGPAATVAPTDDQNAADDSGAGAVEEAKDTTKN